VVSQADLEAQYLKRLCITKLYHCLRREKVERRLAIRSSVSTVERLCECLELSSEQFRATYKRLLRWIHVTTSDYIIEKLEDAVQDLLGFDEKSKDSLQTACSFK